MIEVAEAIYPIVAVQTGSTKLTLVLEDELSPKASAAMAIDTSLDDILIEVLGVAILALDWQAGVIQGVASQAEAGAGKVFEGGAFPSGRAPTLAGVTILAA